MVNFLSFDLEIKNVNKDVKAESLCPLRLSIIKWFLAVALNPSSISEIEHRFDSSKPSTLTLLLYNTWSIYLTTKAITCPRNISNNYIFFQWPKPSTLGKVREWLKATLNFILAVEIVCSHFLLCFVQLLNFKSNLPTQSIGSNLEATLNQICRLSLIFWSHLLFISKFLITFKHCIVWAETL